jgi:hypothetical protein
VGKLYPRAYIACCKYYTLPQLPWNRSLRSATSFTPPAAATLPEAADHLIAEELPRQLRLAGPLNRPRVDFFCGARDRLKIHLIAVDIDEHEASIAIEPFGRDLVAPQIAWA